MSGLRLIHLVSVEELRGAASSWDDLWWRSDVTTPTVRAEMLAQWLERFSPGDDFHALVVEYLGQWVAALPLAQNPRGGLLRTGRMTSNEWSDSGDLILDPGAAVDAVLDVLVAGMREIPWRLLWLNEIPLEAPRWKALRRAVDRAGLASDHHGQTQVGLIEIGHDWEAFRRSLSKKHRCKMARCNRRLEELGEVRLEVLAQLDADQVELRLREAFEIENLSWKGKLGTSVLRTAGMFEFFAGQTRQLAQWGQLELAFLYCGENPVAFSYGCTAKGVSHWHKIGCDPQYHSCTPGQLLQCHLLERFHSTPERRAVDTLGPLTDALAKWNPVRYRVGRLMIAPHRLIGRPLVYATKRLAPYLRRAVRAENNGRPNGKIGRKYGRRSLKYRRGGTVEVRSRNEILATLDPDGKLEGLPFQPEMLKHCGRKYRICRRAEKVFLDHYYYVGKLDNTVLLADVRCDGKSHDGCQMGCLLLWKEAWLKPAGLGESTPNGNPATRSGARPQLPVMHQGRYCCQATELVNATSRLRWWDVRQYLRDLACGELTVKQAARMLALLTYNKFQRMRGRPPYGEVYGRQTKTPAGSLHLEPGDLVEVKTVQEIRETLDVHGKNRGLGFGGSMVDFCGTSCRVVSRVDKLILEWSGEMRKLTDTVTLEGAVCDGLDKRGCPRGCYHLWREIWLKKVP